MVTTAPPDVGALGCATAVSTGASKLKNAAFDVPTDAETVKCRRSRMVARIELTEAAEQATLESEVHDVVSHGTSVTIAVTVKSGAPKFTPDTVIEAPPEGGEL